MEEAFVRARLGELRSLWPSRADINRAIVDDPNVRRSARRGTLLMGIAVACTVAWALPLALWGDLALQQAWQQVLGMAGAFIAMAAALGAIFCAAAAWLEFTSPRRRRRELVFAEFAERAGMAFEARARITPRRGILLGEPSTGSGDTAGNAPGFAYRTAYRLRSVRASMHIAIARARFGQAPYGPFRVFRFLEFDLGADTPHIMIASRSNGAVHRRFSSAQEHSLEGDFDRYFTTYAPEGLGRDVREILTPDVMTYLIDAGQGWSIELVDGTARVAAPGAKQHDDREETSAMLVLFELMSGVVSRRAGSYTRTSTAQERSGRLRQRVLDGGALVAFATCIAPILVFLLR